MLKSREIFASKTQKIEEITNALREWENKVKIRVNDGEKKASFT